MPEETKSHPLDNPIWTALNSGSLHFSFGDEKIRFIDRKMGFFVAMPAYEKKDLEQLHDTLELGKRVILFTSHVLDLDSRWLVHNDHEMLQMIGTRSYLDHPECSEIQALGQSEVAAMLTLTKLTKPGPFFENTFHFGGYFGCFNDGILVSMAGSRLVAGDFTEVSAVCTHPEFQGLGMSKRVLPHVLKYVQKLGKTPFLHLYPENIPALKLYESLGFVSRTLLRVYSLEKVKS